MPRDIAEFKGDSLIIGGGWSRNHCMSKPKCRTPENFYAMDIDPGTSPDKVGDITSNEDTRELKNRFSFIYFEFMSFTFNETGLKVALQNAYEMLTTHGVVLFVGGSHTFEKPVPILMNEAGFNGLIAKQLDPTQAFRYAKNDKGCISLGAKKRLIESGDIQHLSAAAKEYILETFKFFSPTLFNFEDFHAAYDSNDNLISGRFLGGAESKSMTSKEMLIKKDRADPDNEINSLPKSSLGNRVCGFMDFGLIRAVATRLAIESKLDNPSSNQKEPPVTTTARLTRPRS